MGVDKHPLDRLVRGSLTGGLPMVIFLLSLILGAVALQFTPREEEPQIVVPMVDVYVEAPGLSAQQVARQVTTPLEKLLAQIPGVEHVYSSSSTGRATATLRFYVGQDRERSILNTYNKLYSNQDQIPGVVSQWMVRPVEVDDVPIMLLTFWSENSARYSDYELRRLAEEVTTRLQGIENTSEVNLVGGRARAVQVQINPESLAARQTSALDLVRALQATNQLQVAGNWTYGNQSIQLESGDALRSADELANTLVNVVDGVPVLLREVATVVDGPEEAGSYSWIDFAPSHPVWREGAEDYPAVTVSVAKKRGSNAVAVAAEVHQLLDELREELLPPEIHVEVIRDYGQTANEKVNNLASSLGFAILTVVVFLGIFLGWRAAAVVGLALPICYGITLALDMAFGYTINRVTLFALILSLGLLVDDPITGVDNITRMLKEGSGDIHDRIVHAIAELRVPLVMSTLTIALAFVPLAFITGMMGPYMAPMAFNVPVSVIMSTVVAFMVTPWLASRILKKPTEDEQVSECSLARRDTLYKRMMGHLLDTPKHSKLVLWGVLVLFIAAAMLPMLRLVPLKLLPFDNKNEVQIVIDMPRSASLESTAALAQEVSGLVRQLPEVTAVVAYVGEPSPIDFNGMVRQYYQRVAPNLADLRITLLDKSEREHQSHAVVLRLRELLAPYNTGEQRVKVVEVPPGPPVLSTLVVELYGDELTTYDELENAAGSLIERLQREPHVVEVDSSISTGQSRLRFVTDRNKAALSGISTADINQTLMLANEGLIAGYIQQPREATPLPIELNLAVDQRSSLADFERLYIKGQPGVAQQTTATGLVDASQPLVALGELGAFVESTADHVILHKDLKPVVYVMAELNGRTPAEVISDLNADRVDPGTESAADSARPWQTRNFLFAGGGDTWSVPDNISLGWTGEGEWRITKDVFRDMGLAFAFALAAIFVVLRIQTASTSLSLIIMSAIPLTIIGIMPGFWMLNGVGERWVAGSPDPVLFTATAMIGMIALAGIVVRNSLILIEFINHARASGLAIRDALLQCGSVRMRPILLTAGTTLLGNLVITLDPVFSGLALAIIFGIIASTLFTLVVVPVVYLLVFGDTETKDEAPELASES